jgi:hypothetical protein
MSTPQQFWITAESAALANADFDEADRSGEQDHQAHAPGRTCVSCGRIIGPGQGARRRGESDWAHDVCPPSSPESAGA